MTFANITTPMLAANSSVLWVIGGIVLLIFVLVMVYLVANIFRLWIQSQLTRADVGLFELITLCRFARSTRRPLVNNKITLVKSGLVHITTNDLESHYLAGGRVPNVARAMIAADRAKLNLDWKTATAIDLAGRDILDAVHTSVNPKVIDCPNEKSNKATIDAVAMDGIQLKARARVTVRTNLAQLVGGATEETVIARVGTGHCKRDRLLGYDTRRF